MRRYKPAVLFCAACGGKLALAFGEIKMVKGEVYHVLCAVKLPPDAKGEEET